MKKHQNSSYLAINQKIWNHISALAGTSGKEEKVWAFQNFQNFNFNKLENPEPFVRSEAQAF